MVRFLLRPFRYFCSGSQAGEVIIRWEPGNSGDISSNPVVRYCEIYSLKLGPAILDRL